MKRRSSLVRAAKRVLKFRVVNLVALNGLKAILRLVGRESELAIRYFHPVGVVASRLPNGRILRLWTRADEFITTQVFWRGWDGFEPETTPVFWFLASQAQTTLDIGAHVGMLSLLAGHANPSGKVYSFEAFRPVFQRLEVNRSFNDGIRLECFQSSVSDAEGTVDFYYIEPEDGSLPSSSSLSRTFMERSLAFYGLPECRLRHIPVSVTTIDRFAQARSLPRVDLVKIDTESTEPAVLRGMLRVLRRDRPTLIVEILPNSETLQEIKALLTPLGYQYRRLVPMTDRARKIHEALTVVTGRVRGYDNYLFTTGDPDQIVREAHRTVWDQIEPRSD